jgi:hypothetical protein
MRMTLYGVPNESRTWGERERARLRAALKYAGHTERECAEVLRSEFGMPEAKQENVSRWATGATRHPKRPEGLLAYMDTYGPSHDQEGCGENPPAEAEQAAPSSVGQKADLNNQVDGDAAFDALAALAARQPLLGPEQRNLVEAITYRLRHGPPLTDADFKAYALQASLLGLTPSE